MSQTVLFVPTQCYVSDCRVITLSDGGDRCLPDSKTIAVLPLAGGL